MDENLNFNTHNQVLSAKRAADEFNAIPKLVKKKWQSSTKLYPGKSTIYLELDVNMSKTESNNRFRLAMTGNRDTNTEQDELNDINQSI